MKNKIKYKISEYNNGRGKEYEISLKAGTHELLVNKSYSSKGSAVKALPRVCKAFGLNPKKLVEVK